jgi:hypothetical protein
MDGITKNNLDRLKELSKLIDSGEQVKAMTDTDGWKLHIEPVLNKMIIDVMGGIENGRWTNGSLDQKDLGEEKAKELIAYKRALVDFIRYVYQYIDPLPLYHKEYNQIVKDEQKEHKEKEVQTDYEDVVQERDEGSQEA